ncbi:MAG: hypothetical protein U5R31_17140 [Acidimicrobiia bacterium]|nr:hypothetical protein [Acidimicrobiia bacterium]
MVLIDDHPSDRLVSMSTYESTMKDTCWDDGFPLWLAVFSGGLALVTVGGLFGFFMGRTSARRSSYLSQPLPPPPPGWEPSS